MNSLNRQKAKWIKRQRERESMRKKEGEWQWFADTNINLFENMPIHCELKKMKKKIITKMGKKADCDHSKMFTFTSQPVLSMNMNIKWIFSVGCTN